MDAQEVTREEPDYPHARADARRLRPGPARIRAARGVDCSRGGCCGDQLRTGRQQDLRYGRVEVADGGERVVGRCHSVLSTDGARQIGRAPSMSYRGWTQHALAYAQPAWRQP